MSISFARTTTHISRPAFIVDQESVVRDTGRQIDWDLLDARYDYGGAQVVLTESVDIGETALTVEPLTKALTTGDLLDFGSSTGGVITAQAALAAATSVTVTALPRAMRAGEILDFGTSKEVQLSAGAAAGATSITVVALDTALAGAETATIPSVRMVLVLAADAAVGAEAITVDGADHPIESGLAAYYGGSFVDANGNSFIPAGTVMDLLSTGKVIPSALATSGATAFGLLATNADEHSRTDSASGYGMLLGGLFYENLLPEADGADPSIINSTWKTELLARGLQWGFLQYEDDTA